MKLFTQIALVSAIAASSSAMALTAMDDTQLSGATGQDGITILLANQKANVDSAIAAYNTTTGEFAPGQNSLTGTNTFGFSGLAANDGVAGIVTIDKVIVHDKDGYTMAQGNTVAGVEGALVIDGLLIANSDPLRVDIDINGTGGATGATASANGVAGAGTSAYLNVKLTLPKKTLLHIGDISVAQSNRKAANLGSTSVRGVVAASKLKILDGLDIVIGDGSSASELNIQLGAEAQGSMIKASGIIVGGVNIKGLTLRDQAGADGTTMGGAAGGTLTGLGNGQGALYIGTVSIDSGTTAADGTYTSTGLDTSAQIDISTNGLIVRQTSNKKVDLFLEDVRIGTINKNADGTLNMANTTVGGQTLVAAKSVGDVELSGINTFGTKIAISGH